jgi:hypothetical protein
MTLDPRSDEAYRRASEVMDRLAAEWARPWPKPTLRQRLLALWYRIRGY